MTPEREIEELKRGEGKKLPRSSPSEDLMGELVEVLKKQIKREERRKEIERKERARFYLD